MKRSVFVFCVVTLCSAAVSFVTAQSKPNFAGKWTLVMDPSVDPAALGELGRNPVITQDDKTIAVVTMQPSGEVKSVYNLDGSESRNPLKIFELSFDRVSTIRWEGAELIITTKVSAGPQAIETRAIWSLIARDQLVVNTVVIARGERMTVKRTYKKN